MSKKIAVFLAEGFEEAEAIVPIDIARRAGIEVTMVSVSDVRNVTGSHGIKIDADSVLSDIDITEYDMLMLPGGAPGTTNLENSDGVKNAVIKAYKEGKYLAAICAAPRILGELGMLEGKKATVYPGNEEHLRKAVYDDKARAVIDGKVITARGMGCAIDFGKEIVTALMDAGTADKILTSIQYV